MRRLWLLMLAVTGFLVFDALADGRVAAAVTNGVLGLAISWWLSP